MRAAVILAVALLVSCADSPASRLSTPSGNPEIAMPANDGLAGVGEGMRAEFRTTNRGIESGTGEESAIPARSTDNAPAALNPNNANSNLTPRSNALVGGSRNDNRCDPDTQPCSTGSRDAQDPGSKWSVDRVVWVLLFIIGLVGILHPW